MQTPSDWKNSSVDKNICQANRVGVVEKIKSTTTGKIAPTETSDATAAAKQAMFETSAEATQSLGKTPIAGFYPEICKRDKPRLVDRF